MNKAAQMSGFIHFRLKIGPIFRLFSLNPFPFVVGILTFAASNNLNT